MLIDQATIDMLARMLPALNEEYDSLKPIAARSPYVDMRQMALARMRAIETMRGDEKKTEVPATHHK